MSSRQYSDSLRVGILLALTGGFLDAYTYISRGNVFANAQTGNMVMLGINFMEGNFRGIINYIIPIIAFAIGVLLAEVIRTKLSKSEKAPLETSCFSNRNNIINICCFYTI